MKRMLEHINTCFVTPNSGYQKPDEEDFWKEKSNIPIQSHCFDNGGGGRSFF